MSHYLSFSSPYLNTVSNNYIKETVIYLFNFNVKKPRTTYISTITNRVLCAVTYLMIFNILTSFYNTNKEGNINLLCLLRLYFHKININTPHAIIAIIKER